ncbi:MAG TPA: hypothetical protein VIJ68_04315 [Candidatus Saccharimonadales bacterium]
MSDLANIDYQPLQAMKGAYVTVLKNGGLPLAVLGICVVIAGVLIVNGAFILTIYPFFICFIYLGFQVKKFKNSVWQNFAIANGWALDQTTSPAELVPPSVQFGRDPHYSPVIQAQLGNIASDLLLYDCTTGSGKSSDTHYFTVARVRLPKVLPHLLLSSKKSRAYIQKDLLDSQTLELEGDFNDYFKLQIEKGQQVDALTVLTPDVMQVLVNYNKSEDIEILGWNLYFILNGDKRAAEDVQSLIQSVVELTEQIVQNINLASVSAPPVAAALS